MIEPMYQWAVYKYPKDFPGEFIARKWAIEGENYYPTTEYIRSGDLSVIQNTLTRKGLVKLMPSVNDDPVILEVWL